MGKIHIGMGGICWTKEEDHLLKTCIRQHGAGEWQRIPLLAGNLLILNLVSMSRMINKQLVCHSHGIFNDSREL